MIYLILFLLSYPLIGAFCLFSLFVKFVALFAIEKLDFAGTLHPSVKKVGLVLFFRGKVFDVFCNIFYVWIIFGQWPVGSGWTVTERIQRLVDGPDGWRKDRAVWYAVNALNPFCRVPHIKGC